MQQAEELEYYNYFDTSREETKDDIELASEAISIIIKEMGKRGISYRKLVEFMDSDPIYKDLFYKTDILIISLHDNDIYGIIDTLEELINE